MAEFELLALGVGDTFSELHYGASLLLECEGFRLAIDCPDRYRAVLRDAEQKSRRALSLGDIDHMLITHVHGDHMNGLEGVAFFKHFVENKRLGLLASEELLASLWQERLKASMGALWDGARFREMSFQSYFDARALSWTSAITVGPFRIRARRTLHHVPTSALLIEAGGRTLGYSADTAFDPELLEFLAPADLIVHETNYGPAHTPYAKLAALPAELRARMRLIHYADEFDLANSEIEALREGDLVRL